MLVDCDWVDSKTTDITADDRQPRQQQQFIEEIGELITELGMLIPGYLDTRVPCGLPGSRETSDLPSYRDRLHQSTDCQSDYIRASTALAAAENAERPVCS